MRCERRPASWFARLRRDRVLFAAVGVLALLLSALQPAAAVQNADIRALLILCSDIHEGAPVKSPGQGPDCPLCPAGHPCGFHIAPAAPASTPLFEPFAPHQGQPALVRAAGSLPAARGEAPPAIRGPPPKA
jgi:hypothetical protein